MTAMSGININMATMMKAISPDTGDYLACDCISTHGGDNAEHGCESVDAFCVFVHGLRVNKGQ